MPENGIIDATAQRNRRVRRFLALAVFVAATAFYLAGADDLEADLLESQDLNIAHEMWMWGNDNLPTDQSPVSYYLLNFLLRITYCCFGFLRAPAGVCAGLATMLVFLLLDAAVGSAAGLLGAAAMALNPFVVLQARTARSYGLLLLAAAMCLYYAYLYMVKDHKVRWLAGFIAGALLGIYSHFFFFPFVGSLALLFLIDQLRHPRKWVLWLKLLGAAVVGGGLAVPQVQRIFHAVNYAASRNSIYGGIVHQPLAFLRTMGQEFFLGVWHGSLFDVKFLRPDAVMWAFTILVLLGMIALHWRGLIAGLLIIGASLGVAWHLSGSAPVSPRYLTALLPAVCVFIGAFLGKLRRVWLWAPLTVLALGANFVFLNAQFRPPTDWPAAAKYIQSVRHPGEAIATFPGFWKWSFLRYLHDPDIAGFNMPGELDRVFARGGRVTVVEGPGRDYNQIVAYLAKYGDRTGVYESRIRARLLVEHYAAPADMGPPDLSPSDQPTVLLGGIIGSGGYPWQLTPDGDNPFAKLTPLFQSADLTLTGYVPYGPVTGRFMKTLMGVWDGIPRRPNALVADYLAQAGVKGVITVPPEVGGGDPNAVLAGAGLSIVPMQAEWKSAAPVIFPVKGGRVGFLYAGQFVCTDAPRFKNRNEALIPEWDAAVVRAKQQLGQHGHLIVLIPHPPNYDRLFRREDQMLARRAIDLGADAVVHVGGWGAGEVEQYGRGVIAYSLGAMLRPPFLGMSPAWTNGIMLRLRLPDGGPARYEIIPVTYDDHFRLNYGRRGLAGSLRYEPAPARNEIRLTDRIVEARVAITDRANKLFPASRFNPALRLGATVYEGWGLNGAWIGVAGINSLLEFRRVLLMNPASNNKISMTFPQQRLGRTLSIVYGLNDEATSTRRLANQRLLVSVGDKVAATQTVECTAGWRSFDVDTSPWFGQAQDLKIELETSRRADFMVGVDARILGLAAADGADAEPYRFDEHIAEAQTTVEKANGETFVCLGPDETYRQLRHEEDGLYGEGTLYRRWACGENPWDAAALTLQKSGGELRKAIWLHPLADARRWLRYGPLTLGDDIEGFGGFTDLAVNGIVEKNGTVTKWNDTPVTLSVYADDRLLYQQVFDNTNGWKPFRFPVPNDLRGKIAKISFLAETANASWRHFCFDAWMPYDR